MRASAARRCLGSRETKGETKEARGRKRDPRAVPRLGEIGDGRSPRPRRGLRPIYPPPTPNATVRSPSLPRVTLTDLVDLCTIEYSRREEDSEDGRERENPRCLHQLTE